MRSPLALLTLALLAACARNEPPAATPASAPPSARAAAPTPSPSPTPTPNPSPNPTPSPAAPRRHFVAAATFDAIASDFSGERARETLSDLVEYHRIQGSPMMEKAAERVVLDALKAAHVEASLEQFPSDGARRYGTFVSPLGWDMRGGELWLDPPAGSKEPPVRLCRYADVPMCVATYSKGGEWSGELVDVGPGIEASDYAGKDVRGKVVLASGYASRVVRAGVIQRGAVGAVIYPSATDRPSHPDMIRYNGLWTHASEIATTRGAFMISANQYALLQERMKHGPTSVHGRVDADLEPYKLTLVHAYLRGREEPGQEVLVTAHLDHPKWSANDNASGSAAMLEIVRVLSAQIAAGKIARPRRTLHFVWVPEFFGSAAYVASHPEVRRCGPWDDPRPAPAKTTCVVANVNMDMVGEDTVKTGSRFYFTRAPDSVPSFLTTLLTDVLQQTREARLVATTGTHDFWNPEVVPYFDGSDHDVFLGLGIPSTMLGHDPDWTHHTSEDTLDKTDATELRRVGVFAAAAAHWLAAAGPAEWASLETLARADRAGEDAHRAARASVFAPELALAARPAGLGLPGEAAAPTSAGVGPRRLVTLPLDDTALEDLAGEDKAWWEEQGERFPGRAGAPSFDVMVFETINFMDGHRSSADIARLLSAEFFAPLDAAWVDRVIGILASHGLVAVPPAAR